MLAETEYYRVCIKKYCTFEEYQHIRDENFLEFKGDVDLLGLAYKQHLELYPHQPPTPPPQVETWYSEIYTKVKSTIDETVGTAPEDRWGVFISIILVIFLLLVWTIAYRRRVQLKSDIHTNQHMAQRLYTLSVNHLAPFQRQTQSTCQMAYGHPFQRIQQMSSPQFQPPQYKKMVSLSPLSAHNGEIRAHSTSAISTQMAGPSMLYLNYGIQRNRTLLQNHVERPVQMSSSRRLSVDSRRLSVEEAQMPSHPYTSPSAASGLMFSFRSSVSGNAPNFNYVPAVPPVGFDMQDSIEMEKKKQKKPVEKMFSFRSSTSGNPPNFKYSPKPE